MANEWTIVELYGSNNDGEKRRYTIADGTACSQGTLLTLSTPRTAAVASDSIHPQFYAGVAAEEHKPSIGVTSVSVYTNGIFSAKGSGAILAGTAITGAAANYVTSSGALIVASGANILGYALDTFADGETKTVRLRL